MIYAFPAVKMQQPPEKQKQNNKNNNKQTRKNKSKIFVFFKIWFKKMFMPMQFTH